MKYYSEKLDKMFDTIEELENAEGQHDKENASIQKRKVEIQQELEQYGEDINDINQEIKELVDERSSVFEVMEKLYKEYADLTFTDKQSDNKDKEKNKLSFLDAPLSLLLEYI